MNTEAGPVGHGPEANPTPVRQELDRILESRTFARSAQLRRFLDFTVTATLDGRADQVKEYTIAVEAYRRPADFDARADAIVRTEAYRLRKKLDEYYSSEGSENPIRISYPKGSYVPTVETTGSASELEPIEAKEPIRSRQDERRQRTRLGPLPWIAVATLGLIATVAILSLRSRDVSATRDTPRVAVVPFQDLSEGGRHAAIALATSDSILTELTRWSGIEVAARGVNAEPWDPTNMPLAQFVETLDAEYLLQGTFHRLGERCRVSTQLVRSADDTAVWAQEYTFDWTRIFEVQVEVAADVAAEIGARVSTGAPSTRSTPKTEAYESLARARYALIQYSDTVMPAFRRQAEEELERALSLEPDYVDALALQAGLQVARLFPPGPGSDRAVREMEPLLERALELDPRHVPTLTLLAELRAYQRDLGAALLCLARATAIDPGDPNVYRSAGIVYRFFGFYESSIAAFEQSIDLRSRSGLPHRNRISLLLALNRVKEAEEAIELFREYNAPGPHLPIIETEYQLYSGDLATARETATSTVRRFEGLANVGAPAVQYGLASALLADTEEGSRILEQYREKPRFRDDLVELALVLGKESLALSLIERTPTTRHYRWLVTNPSVRSYLDRPAFRDLADLLYAEWQASLELARHELPVSPPELPPPDELLAIR